MADIELENNQVMIVGVVASEFVYSHEVFGERFYMLDVAVRRLSRVEDIIPLTISERLIDVTKNYVGKTIQAKGQFRSYNKREAGRKSLVLSVFVRDIQVLHEELGKYMPNEIYLDGYICKQPVYRLTPKGREIADMLLAVNRPYGKSDYLPCICWGRNARFAGGFDVGKHVLLWGRIQSRTYHKCLEGEQTIKRTAYEISVSKMKCIGQKELTE